MFLKYSFNYRKVLLKQKLHHHKVYTMLALLQHIHEHTGIRAVKSNYILGNILK